MVVTKKYIHDLREKSFLNISKNAEKIILEKLGQEPVPNDNGFVHEYTEQDICEEVRKIIRDN